MTQLRFIDRINWRQILLHLIGTLFFILAFRQFARLTDTNFIDIIGKYGVKNGTKYLWTISNNMPQRITDMAIWIYLSTFIGMLTAFIVSIFMTIKYKGFWLNSLFVLLFALIFFQFVLLNNQFGFLNNRILKIILFSFGSLFADLGYKYCFIANGTILFLLGIFIFFFSWTRNFAFNYKIIKTDKIKQDK